MEIDDVSAEVIDACIGIHRELGPGLLESGYEIVLAGELHRRGLKIDRQMPIDIDFKGVVHRGAFRIDLLVEDAVVLGIKSVDQFHNAHIKQLLTYLRLTRLEVGLLLNFVGATMKEGIRRVVNEHRQMQAASASLRLRVKNQSGGQ